MSRGCWRRRWLMTFDELNETSGFDRGSGGRASGFRASHTGSHRCGGEVVLCVSHGQRYEFSARSTFLHFAVKCICGLAVTRRGVKQNAAARRSHLLPTRSHRAKKCWLSAPTMTKAAAAAGVDGSVENATLILGPFTLKVPAVCLFSSFCHRQPRPGRSI